MSDVVWFDRFQRNAVPYRLTFGTDWDDRNNCTVIALSNATTLSYQEAYEVLEAAGRKRHGGFRLRYWLRSLEQKKESVLGHRFTCVFNSILHSRVYGKETAPHELLAETRAKNLTLHRFIKSQPKGNYIVCVRGHALSVVDGVVLNNFRPRGGQIVRMIFKVELA